MGREKQGSDGQERADMRCWMRVATIALLMITGWLGGGCSSLLSSGADKQPVSEYILEWTGSPRPSPAPRGPVLLVNPPYAAAGYTGSQMVYVQKRHQQDYFLSHRWSDTPAHMLEPLILSAADASGVFSHAVSTGSRIDGDMQLDTEVLRLQQVFIDGRNDVELALRVTLVDLGRSRVIDSRVLSVTEPAKDPCPYGGVQAANRAADRVLKNLVSFLQSAVRHRR